MTLTQKNKSTKGLIPSALFIGFLCLITLINVTFYRPADDIPEQWDEELVAMRDRNAELPTLFDINQDAIRNDERRTYKFSDPSYYQGRPDPR